LQDQFEQFADYIDDGELTKIGHVFDYLSQKQSSLTSIDLTTVENESMAKAEVQLTTDSAATHTILTNIEALLISLNTTQENTKIAVDTSAGKISKAVRETSPWVG